MSVTKRKQPINPISKLKDLKKSQIKSSTVQKQLKERDINPPLLKDLLKEHLKKDTYVDLFSLEPIEFPSDRYTAVQSLEVNVTSALTENQSLYHQLFTETKKQ